jgi:hypothetical protein
MTTKNAKGATIEPNGHIETQTEDERAAQRSATDALMAEQTQDTNSVEYLKAERARANAAYKEAREKEKLAREALRALKPAKAARNTDMPTHTTKPLSVRVKKLITSGVERDDAITIVLEQVLSALVAFLDREAK